MPKPKDEAWAWTYLERLVAIRPRTESELRRRLAAKGCAPEIVEKVLAKAREAGLVDDEKFARLYAEDRLLSRPRSRKLLARELRARGIDPHLAEEASRAALPERSERALACQALERRLPLLRRLPKETAKRRAYSFLLRRGFPRELAREVVEELVMGDE